MNKEFYKTLPKIAQEFLNYLSAIKSQSDLTVQGYARDLQIYFRFLKIHWNLVSETVPFDEIDVSDLSLDQLARVNLSDGYAYLTYCKNIRQNGSAARARKAVSLKRFYRFITINYPLVLEKNPFQELESPKLKKSLPKHLTLDQSIDLLQCVDGNFRERDYCILTLFLNCGLRLSELVSLNLKDIRSDNTMRVTGKGNKERTIYLNQACNSALNRYLNVRQADGIADRDALFISRNRKRISVRAVQNIIEKFLQKAGLSEQGFSVHKLRHTAATLMYQYGNVDVLLLKEILGHENLTTTEIYTHIQNEQLKRSVDSNPLNSLSPSDHQEN